MVTLRLLTFIGIAAAAHARQAQQHSSASHIGTPTSDVSKLVEAVESNTVVLEKQTSSSKSSVKQAVTSIDKQPTKPNDMQATAITDKSNAKPSVLPPTSPAVSLEKKDSKPMIYAVHPSTHHHVSHTVAVKKKLLSPQHLAAEEASLAARHQHHQQFMAQWHQRNNKTRSNKLTQVVHSPYVHVINRPHHSQPSKSSPIARRQPSKTELQVKMPPFAENTEKPAALAKEAAKEAPATQKAHSLQLPTTQHSQTKNLERIVAGSRKAAPAALAAGVHSAVHKSTK